MSNSTEELVLDSVNVALVHTLAFSVIEGLGKVKRTVHSESLPIQASGTQTVELPIPKTDIVPQGHGQKAKSFYTVVVSTSKMCQVSVEASAEILISVSQPSVADTKSSAKPSYFTPVVADKQLITVPQVYM